MAKYSTEEKIEGKIKRSLTDEEKVNIDNTIELISNSVSSFLNRYWNDIDYTEERHQLKRLDIMTGMVLENFLSTILIFKAFQRLNY